MSAAGRLAEFLKARRERTSPQDVDLVVAAGIRRVPGLRREEVAVLAGISTDYYLRLEQGRDIHPSDQVIESLARALRLDQAATLYLRGLAARAPSAPRAEKGDVVSDSAAWLIDSWPLAAAMIHDRYITVLASNALARALNPNYRVGINSVLATLVDPAERVFHADWEGLAARCVGLLRAVADSPQPDARLEALVAEGSRSSELFREFWERREVTRVGNGTHLLRHPDVGELSLRFLRLPLLDTDGQSIFLYLAEPGSPSEDAMRRLAARG